MDKPHKHKCKIGSHTFFHIAPNCSGVFLLACVDCEDRSSKLPSRQDTACGLCGVRKTKDEIFPSPVISRFPNGTPRMFKGNYCYVKVCKVCYGEHFMVADRIIDKYQIPVVNWATPPGKLR